jgi:flagellar FliJ protein
MATAPFKFRLERVRAMRERSEDEAKEGLAQSMAARARGAGRLSESATQVQAARDGQLGAATRGVNVEHMLAHQAFIERTERAQQAAEIDLSRQDAEVAARRVALQEAARDRQVLEKLKDKQATAHRREAERVESRQIDELALAAHRRRSAAL